jgi:hypothetical protein
MLSASFHVLALLWALVVVDSLRMLLIGRPAPDARIHAWKTTAE